MMDEKVLQDKLAAVEQQLIQMHTSQWGQNDTWIPYHYEVMTAINVTSGKNNAYFRLEWISPIREPSLRILFGSYPFMGNSGLSSAWLAEVGSDDFTDVYYDSISNLNTYASQSPLTVTYTIFSTQPGELKITEITEAEYLRDYTGTLSLLPASVRYS